MATVLMASSETVAVQNVYARNGVDKDRIARILDRPCKCGECQARTLNFKHLHSFLERFHTLTVESKTHLLSTVYDTAGPMPVDQVAHLVF